MSLPLAALVLASLHPSAPVLSASLGQKVEVIKGKKSAKKTPVVVDAPELAPQPITDNSAQAQQQRKAELDQKEAQLSAKEKELASKQAQLDEQEKQSADAEKAKADKLKQQQKVIERIGAQNQKMYQQAADALAGGE